MADDLRKRYIRAIGACEQPTMEELADAVLAVRDDELAELRAVVERDITIDSWLYRRVERAEADALAMREAVERFRKFLNRDFRQWCSPNGVAAEYAARLIGQLDRFVYEEQTGNGDD